MNKIFALIPLLVLGIIIGLAISAYAGRLLTIKYPDQNVTVPANKFIVVNGTSAPSNATHTHCNVQLQINQNGYNPVTPKGAVGTYTNWTTTSSELMKVGHNEIEAQLLCFPPVPIAMNANATGTPNLIKHLTHNVTGTAPSAHGITLLNSTG